jgi:FixJ family two-component response regulator
VFDADDEDTLDLCVSRAFAQKGWDSFIFVVQFELYNHFLTSLRASAIAVDSTMPEVIGLFVVVFLSNEQHYLVCMLRLII